MGDITSFGTSTLKSFCNIAIGKIDYFEVTRFKTQRISAEIVADFTKSWSTEYNFFLAGSFEVVSFETGSFESFPFVQIGLDEVLAMMRC